MKKIIAVVLCAVLMLSCFSMVASAKVGDVIGLALHTDIVAYINHYAIPSYAVNGQSVIVAEDLRNFGFDVTWDQWDRSLTISRNWDTNVKSMSVNKAGVPGTKFTDIYATDIKVYAGGKRITSYAMNGYTMVPMEELTMFGEVHWVQNERALKMWVDGLHMRSTKQPVNGSTSAATSTAVSSGSTGTSSGSYAPSKSSKIAGIKAFAINKGSKVSSGSYVALEQYSNGATTSVHYDPADEQIAVMYTSSDGSMSIMLSADTVDEPRVSIFIDDEMVYFGIYYSSTVTTIMNEWGDVSGTLELLGTAYELFDLYFSSENSSARISDLGISY